MTHTEWRPIEGLNGFEVSSDGRVRRGQLAPTAINTKPGLEYAHDTSTGYARVSLRVNSKPHKLLVHRLVARAFLPPALPFSHVNHKDGNKLNNNVSNLEWCTPQENVHHAWRSGLSKPVTGSRHGSAKLNEGDVAFIREARKRGFKLANIAEVFGVTETQVSRITRGQGWITAN